MKIIGFVYLEKQSARSDLRQHSESNDDWEMVLKGDSCLLNGRKPMFVPDWTEELCVTDCMIIRVSRLGKEIAPKFANRYYDAVAPGLDFVAMDKLREAQSSGHPWTSSIAFDYSLAIGEWCEGVKELGSEGVKEWLMSPEEAIVEASKVMTIRQGDLIYIQKKEAPRAVHREKVISREINGQEKLYCKIK